MLRGSRANAKMRHAAKKKRNAPCLPKGGLYISRRLRMRRAGGAHLPDYTPRTARVSPFATPPFKMRLDVWYRRILVWHRRLASRLRYPPHAPSQTQSGRPPRLAVCARPVGYSLAVGLLGRGNGDAVSPTDFFRGGRFPDVYFRRRRFPPNISISRSNRTLIPPRASLAIIVTLKSQLFRKRPPNQLAIIPIEIPVPIWRFARANLKPGLLIQAHESTPSTSP